MRGSCYFCHWGWPPEIQAVYERGLEAAGHSAMHFGPAHVVWEDENFDSAQWCIDHFDNHSEKLDDVQRAAVLRSLQELVALPDPLKTSPEGYVLEDDTDPADFPPPWAPSLGVCDA